MDKQILQKLFKIAKNQQKLIERMAQDVKPITDEQALKYFIDLAIGNTKIWAQNTSVLWSSLIKPAGDLDNFSPITLTINVTVVIDPKRVVKNINDLKNAYVINSSIISISSDNGSIPLSTVNIIKNNFETEKQSLHDIIWEALSRDRSVNVASALSKPITAVTGPIKINLSPS